jgi:GT2 family glycosyltransferase
MVLDLVDSLGQHDDVRIIAVVDSLAPVTVAHELAQNPIVKLVHFNEEFNFAKKCNQGAAIGESDIVFFLNDDTVSLTSDWPAAIRSALEYESVAAVGGLLVDREGRVQCAGHANHPVPHLFGSGLDPEDPNYASALAFPREVSGLSGACLAVKRSAFEHVGGMCEALPNSYNDVDLGFKLLAQGWSLLYEPNLKFIHFESASREPTVDPFEFELISSRWGRFFERDPFTPW